MKSQFIPIDVSQIGSEDASLKRNLTYVVYKIRCAHREGVVGRYCTAFLVLRVFLWAVFRLSKSFRSDQAKERTSFPFPELGESQYVSTYCSVQQSQHNMPDYVHKKLNKLHDGRTSEHLSWPFCCGHTAYILCILYWFYGVRARQINLIRSDGRNAFCPTRNVSVTIIIIIIVAVAVVTKTTAHLRALSVTKRPLSVAIARVGLLAWFTPRTLIRYLRARSYRMKLLKII